MKNTHRFFATITLSVFFILCVSNISFATTVYDLDQPASDTFKNSGSYVVSVLSAIGIVTSVVVLGILGIKYMLGSVDERAEYKSSFMPYFVGAGLVFGASVIAEIIYKLVI